MPNIIGEEFDDFVQEQINIRQKIHGSGIPNNPRSNEYINYLNSKTAWVKLASGVNITPERLEKEGITSIDAFQKEKLAKNRILYGGVSRLNESEKKLIQRGTDPTKNNITDFYTGTYNVNQNQQSTDLEFGLVPMPGIVDVSIKNKNRGSIKEATIKIKAYTRDQFDFLDILYMRLGYTVFLEWGWSLYFNNTEEFQNMGHTLIEAKNGFFNSKWENEGYTSFLDIIRKYRVAKNGNYDGLLAKVRNFEWTISEDGTYDITLSLISMGDVIESLKINTSPSIPIGNTLKKLQALVDTTDEENPESEGKIPVDNSLLAYLYLYKLTAQQDEDSFFADLTFTNKSTIRIPVGRFLKLDDAIRIDIYKTFSYSSWNPLSTKPIKDVINKRKELEEEFKDEIANGTIFIFESPIIGAIPPNSYKLIISGFQFISNPTSNVLPKDVFQLNYQDEDGEPAENGYYIRLGSLLTYIEDKIIPKESKSKNKIINLNTSQYGNFMYYHPLQFSHDPRVCLVNSEVTQFKKPLEILPQLPGWHKEGNDYAWTMNIYVNFTQVENSMNENLDEEGNLSLFNFLSSLCTAINKAMGGVNNLEPVLDEETNTINIIDGSYTPNKSPNYKYGLELYGYNPKFNSSNFVRNFSIKSTISKEYASMVSIGSTAGGYTKGTEATMFSKWNNGLIDRFKEKYEPGDPESVAPSGSQDEAVTNYIENILKTPIQGLGYASGKSQLVLDSEVIDSNLSIATEFYKYVQSDIQKAYPKYASPTAGFIPISLNTTLDGISGMKIYNVVRVSTRFLPKNYTESLRFIIKSVDHKLSNNDWETSIDTVVIPENYDEKGSKLILPYDKLVDEVKRILKEGLSKLDGELSSIVGKIAAEINSAPSLPPPTSIGSGDKIRVDADLTTPWIKNSVDGKARGAYRYLQIITKTPKTGAGQYYKIPGTTAFITSGFGQRDVPSGTHQAIDIAAGGKLPQTCPFQKGKIIQQSPNTYGIIKIQELNPTTNKPTGRYARFLHSNYFGFNQGDIVKFNDIVGKEGRAGKNNPLAYGIHSHFELTVTSNSSKATVDNKRAVKYPSGKLPGWFIAPTIEEIKCAHGLSNTPLPLPEVSTKNGVTNYKCIF